MKQNGKSGGNSARTAVLILCGAVLAAAVGFAVHAGVTSGADNEIAVTEETVPVSGSAVVEEELPETVIEPEEPAYEPASLSLIAVGDNLIHGTLLKDASNGDGTYDFTPFYEDIKPYVEAADIALLNQESPLGTGTPSAYPTFNTPQSCGKALIDAGFDVVSHANNHAMDSGSSALYDTLDFWDSQADTGVIRIGIARDAEDRAEVRYLERNGIKVGFLAYT